MIGARRTIHRTKPAAVTTTDPVYLVVITGESNAAGTAANTDATVGELAARSAVKIWNNTGSTFENIDVGTNNNISQNFDGAYHGIELALTNTAAAGRWGSNTLYVVKSAWSGSRISSWLSGQTNRTNLASRISAALAELSGLGITPVPIVFYSQGINDANAAYSSASWAADTVGHFAYIRSLLGASTRIVATNFTPQVVTTPALADYNIELTGIAANDPLTTVLETSSFPLADGLHWGYTGFRQMAEAFTDAAIGVETVSEVTPLPAAGAFSASQSVILSSTGAAIYYTADGSVPTTGATLHTSAISVTESTTIKAVGVRKFKKNGAVATLNYDIGKTIAWDTSRKSSDITLSNGNVDAISAGGSGFNTVIANIGRISGKYYFEVKVVAYDGSNANYFAIGVVAGIPTAFNNYPGNSALGVPGASKQGGTQTNLRSDMTAGTNALLTVALNEVIGVAVDLDAGKIWLAQNGSFALADGVNTDNGADPTNGVNPWTTFTPGTRIYPAVALYQNNATNKLRILGAGTLAYSPPSGFSSWGT